MFASKFTALKRPSARFFWVMYLPVRGRKPWLAKVLRNGHGPRTNDLLVSSWPSNLMEGTRQRDFYVPWPASGLCHCSKGSTLEPGCWGAAPATETVTASKGRKAVRLMLVIEMV
jgi:hypothetical protein